MVAKVDIDALPEDLRRFARERLASGEVSSESALLVEALEALRWRHQQLEALRAEVARGMESPLLDGDEVIAGLRERRQRY